MRSFFALPLSVMSQLQIQHWREKVFPRDVPSIPAENFHITLRFLGDVTSAQLDQLCRTTNDLVNTQTLSEFRLEVTQCAYWASPGILWIGPSQWPKPLNNLVKALNDQINQSIGRTIRDDYQPHISIFRSKTPLPKPLIAPEFTLGFDEFVLYESVQKKSGICYREIESWPLKRLFQQPNHATKSRPLPNKRH